MRRDRFGSPNLGEGPSIPDQQSTSAPLILPNWSPSAENEASDSLLLITGPCPGLPLLAASLHVK